MAAKKITEVTPEQYLSEPVTITLIRDNHRYTDDVVVTYNGKNYQLKRGVSVTVPRGVKLILDSSARQKLAASDYQKKLSGEFEKKTQNVLLGAAVQTGLPII